MSCDSRDMSNSHSQKNIKLLLPPHQNVVIYNSAKHFVYAFYIPEVQYEVYYNISLLYLDSLDSFIDSEI